MTYPGDTMWYICYCGLDVLIGIKTACHFVVYCVVVIKFRYVVNDKIYRGRNMKHFTGFATGLFMFGMVGIANATLFLSGDGSLTNELNANTFGNQKFFTNVLEGGTNVSVFDGYVDDFDNNINDFYNTLTGVSSTIVSGPVTDSLLAGVDLFFVSLPENLFNAGEISAFDNYLNDGGSLFFLGENGKFFSANNNIINNTLIALGSGMSIISNSIFDPGGHTATGNQIAVDTFTTGVNSFRYAGSSQITGGNSLFFGSGGETFVAYETGTAPVPEPATMLLFGTGLIGLAGVSIRRRKK